MKLGRIAIILSSIALALLIVKSPAAALIVICSLIAVFICVKIKTGVFLIFFIFIYPTIPFHVGIDIGVNLPVLRLHRLLTIFLIICWISKNRPFFSFKSFIKFPLTRILWVAIPIYLLSYLSKSNFKGWIFFMGNFFFENFMVAFIFYDVLKDKTTEEIKKMFFFIAISVVLPFLLGAVEHVSGFNIFSKIAPFREILKKGFPIQERLGAIRVRGGFIHSISYGLFFAMAAPAGMLLFALKRKSTIKYYLMLTLFLILCFMGTYMSLSRVAFLIFCINTFVLLIFSNIFTAVIFSVLIFFIFTQPFFMLGMKERVLFLAGGILGSGYVTSEMASSSYGRLEQISIHLRTILESPFLGTGGLAAIGVIDNNYLSLILNSGLLGLLSYLAFFILPMFLSFQMLMRSKDTFYKNISFYTIVILISTFLIFSVLSLTDYLYIVWIYIGLFMASRAIYGKTVCER